MCRLCIFRLYIYDTHIWPKVGKIFQFLFYFRSIRGTSPKKSLICSWSTDLKSSLKWIKPLDPDLYLLGEKKEAERIEYMCCIVCICTYISSRQRNLIGYVSEIWDRCAGLSGWRHFPLCDFRCGAKGKRVGRYKMIQVTAYFVFR